MNFRFVATALATLVALSLQGCTSALVNATSFSPGPVITNLSYGSLARQKYDVYEPANNAENTPAVFFVYGGSWDSGEKGTYEFVGNAFASEGFITAIPDYRVYPNVIFPAFVQDAAKAFAAFKKRIGPDRPVFLAGHSAGAQIAALLAYDPRYLSAVGIDHCRDIAGFVGISGPYDFLPLTKKKFFEIFPKSVRPQSQPINFASGRKAPSLLIHSRDDEVVHAEDTTKMAAALRRAGNKANVKLYDGASHAETLGAMAPVIRYLAPTRADAVRFMKRHVASNHSCG